MSRPNSDTKPKKASDVRSIPAKRLYRGVLEYSRRLDNGRQHRRNLMSVFQSEQTSLRHKLRDACEKLMFSHPLEYGYKAEELMWRKVYYEVIQLVKNNKKFMKPGSRLEMLYKEYLSAAIGYYHHLLMKLQSKYEPNAAVDFPYVNSPLGENSNRKRQILFENSQELEEKNRKKSTSPKGKGDKKESEVKEEILTIDQWALGTCYKILLCLGDLGRYLVEHGGSRPFAERFYQLALLLKPNVGLPLNQIGSLAGHSWWGLTAAYYYYRCLEAEQKFDGADWNLQKLLDRNKKNFYQIPTDALENMISAEEYKKEHTRIFIISFLYLCDLLRPKTYATDVEITGLCKKLIDAFPVCLSHTPFPSEEIGDGDRTAPQGRNSSRSLKRNSGGFSHHHHHFASDYTYLQPHIVLKMCSLCILNIGNLQISRSNRSSAAICFTLAFFSHLLGHVIDRLDPEKDNAKQKENLPDEGAANEEKEEVITDENGDGDASHAQTSARSSLRKKKSRMLRRRRHRGSGDSDLSEGELYSGSDLSESDEDSEDSDSSSATSTNSELSQEEMDETILENPTQGPNKSDKSEKESSKESSNSKAGALIEKRTGLELANSLANGQSTLASLKDMSQRMFQPTVRRRILLAPSFFNNISKPKEESVGSTNGQITNTLNGTKEEAEVKQAVEKEDSTDNSKDLETTKSAKVCSNGGNTEPANNSDASAEEKESDPECSTKVFQQMLAMPQLFGSLKLLCDWLDANEKVVAACAQNSKALWSRITKLTRLMPDEGSMKKIDGVASDKTLAKQLEILESCIGSSKKWKQVSRLPEDYIFSGSNSTVQYLNGDDKKLKSLVCELSQTQQNVIRICRIRSFCHSLVGVDGSEITYQKASKKFEGPEEPQEDDSEHLDIQAMEEMRKARLMKDMAELRLRNEVNALESQLGTPRTRDATLCLYLVPDALALCHDLPHIRKLLSSEKYFIVIPRTVIDGLDGLKKDLQGARDAIRFLETEFKKGNRFVKAQKDGEALKGSLQGERPKLKRNDMQAWRFYRIIECCQFIIQEKSKEETEQKADTVGLVAILTHSTDKSTLSQNQINAITAAESLGIQVFSAVQFSKLWKKLPSSAKK